MNEIMILLVGEQPAPNLLPLRYFQPKKMLLVKTSHPTIRQIAARLKDFFAGEIEAEELEVEAYAFDDIRDALTQKIKELGWQSNQLLFNITGGTKPMSIAAYQVAACLHSSAIYLETKSEDSVLHRYQVGDCGDVSEIEQKTIKKGLTLDDYLHLHLGEYDIKEMRDNFEKEVYPIFKASREIDEVLHSVRPKATPTLELDLVFRRGNQIGVVEVKNKSADKAAIDQLNSATGQRHLGTYVKKFIICSKPMGSNNRDLAAAYGIHVIEVPKNSEIPISVDGGANMISQVLEKMGRRA